MSGPNYWKYPILLFYWAVLKKGRNIKEWYDVLKKTTYTEPNAETIEQIVAFIEKYGIK